MSVAINVFYLVSKRDLFKTKNSMKMACEKD